MKGDRGGRRPLVRGQGRSWQSNGTRGRGVADGAKRRGERSGHGATVEHTTIGMASNRGLPPISEKTATVTGNQPI